MSSHWFGRSQWALPTQAAYLWLRELFNRQHTGVLDRTYSSLTKEYAYLKADYQFLRKEYETLKQEYETLRRSFRITPDVPNTDVWQFPPAKPRKGKHPCEKPLDLMRHIMTTSTRPGHVVLDAFMGSGSTGVAAQEAGCSFIGIEQDRDIFRMAQELLASVP
ncbi:site-specific DNA-methyltransferase [Chitinimonas arctica]|uniref:Methyltransferase n=1 Tax=Chitinimonas arctica TaxID=2594795 RepID=A0A516S9W0_9NEIS|nr:site-specific DNA-methyltransferase [Chitinimonas arctica]QDQ24945.1 site-specific DNA-methyltransferase [Chitinimonas arctica]